MGSASLNQEFPNLSGLVAGAGEGEGMILREGQAHVSVSAVVCGETRASMAASACDEPHASGGRECLQ